MTNIRKCCSSLFTEPHYDGCEVEAMRVNRWHMTRDASLQGMLASGSDKDRSAAAMVSLTGISLTKALAKAAAMVADECHGPLEFKP